MNSKEKGEKHEKVKTPSLENEEKGERREEGGRESDLPSLSKVLKACLHDSISSTESIMLLCLTGWQTLFSCHSLLRLQRRRRRRQNRGLTSNSSREKVLLGDDGSQVRVYSLSLSSTQVSDSLIFLKNLQKQALSSSSSSSLLLEFVKPSMR